MCFAKFRKGKEFSGWWAVGDLWWVESYVLWAVGGAGWAEEDG